VTTLEEIGGVLGYVAFAGVAVLIFLTFQQARHVRRLREWAGRAPERAIAAADRDDEIGAGATAVRPEEASGPGRIERVRESLKPRFAELNRRLPVEPKVLAAGLFAVLLGVGIATSGFGLVGGEDGEQGEAVRGEREDRQSPAAEEKPEEPVVAVLNASGSAPGQPGTPGLADKIGGTVADAGYELGEVTNADSLPISVVMFAEGAEGAEEAAAELASDVEAVLGETETTAITDAVAALAGEADLAVVIGFDDAGV